MIRREEIIKIGKLRKPHGVKGEMSFTYTDRSFENNRCPFLILEIDGIFVPFRLQEVRLTSDTNALIFLKGIDSDKKAGSLVNKDVYYPKKYLNEDLDPDFYTWDSFIGYTLVDEKKGNIGKIDAVDESTINTLFVVQRENQELLIPAADEMLTHIDEDQKKLYVLLPDGLLDL